MEIKFDFEVDDRFTYQFDEDEYYFKLDTVKDTTKVFLKHLEIRNKPT